MNGALPVQWLAGPMSSTRRRGGFQTLTEALTLFGEPERWTVRVTSGPVRTADLVPLARSIADGIMERVAERARQRSRGVSCRKGCSACCRYLVPLSVPEAVALERDLATLAPARRAEIDRAFLAAARQAIRAGLPAPACLDSGRGRAEGPPDSEALSSWYARLGLPCPLLAGDICGLYTRRPLVCREHLIAGSPQACAGRRWVPAWRLEPPVSVARALCRLDARVEGASERALMMPLALESLKIQPHMGRQTLPGPEMVRLFFDALRELAGG